MFNKRKKSKTNETMTETINPRLVPGGQVPMAVKMIDTILIVKDFSVTAKFSYDAYTDKIKGEEHYAKDLLELGPNRPWHSLESFGVMSSNQHTHIKWENAGCTARVTIQYSYEGPVIVCELEEGILDNLYECLRCVAISRVVLSAL